MLLNLLQGKQTSNTIERLLFLFMPFLMLTGSAMRAQEPTFKIDVQLVRLLATVKDVDGRLIGNLQRGNFIIHDNGVRQEVSVFERDTGTTALGSSPD